MQNRLGLCYTTILINCHPQTHRENIMIRYTVNSAFRRLQPKITKSRKYNKVRRMRESGKIQGIYSWSNGWSFSIEFHRINSKWKIKRKDVNKEKNLTNFTLSILFVISKGRRWKKGLNNPSNTKNNFHLWHLPSLFSSMRSTSNKLVDHLRKSRWTNTTYGFQDMKKVKLMLKPVNMT